MKKISVVLVCVFLWGCGELTPPCHFNGVARQAVSAGCIVLNESKVLLVQIPGGRFEMPNGLADSDESAQCVAERQAFETAGIEVIAEELAIAFEDGSELFWCKPLAGTEIKISRPLEIMHADWYAREQFDDLRWRYPSEPLYLEALLKKRWGR